MAYLGKSPVTGKFQKLDDISSGFNDSTTTFAVQSNGTNVQIDSAQQLLISIDGVLQEPTSAYTISPSAITFTEAPNTNATFFAILLGETGTVATVPDGSVTAAKLVTDAVETVKIKDLNVTAGKLATDAVETAKIKDLNVTTAKIADTNITTAKIADLNVTTAKVAADAVTSDKIAPLLNLQEKILVSGSAFSSPTAINLLENSVIYSTAAATGNFTINFKGDGSTSLNAVMSTGNIISAAVLVTNTTTPYYINAYQVEGTASGVTTEVQGGSALSAGNANSIDVYNFSIIKTADATYTILISQTQFA